MRAITRVRRKEYLPFIGLFILQMVLHLVMGKTGGRDDGVFEQYYEVFLDWDWQMALFNTWSSRIFINNVAILFSGINVWFWRALDSAFIALIPYSVSKLFHKTKSFQFNSLVVAVWLLYPVYHMTSAGWVVTTTSYLWPIAAGLYSCALLRDSVTMEKTSRVQLFVGLLALVFACNAEQNAVVLTVLIGAAWMYCICKKTGKQKYFIAMMIICILSLLLHLLCPGNQRRNLVSTGNFFPEYPMLSVVEKLQLGFVEIAANMFFAPNWTHLLLCSIVFVIVMKKYRNLCIRMMALVPLMTQLLVGFFHPLTQWWAFGSDIVPYISSQVYYTEGRYSGMVTLSNYTNIVSYLPIFLLTFSMLCLAISIYYCMCAKPMPWFASLLYLCGIGSGVIMGFSSSIYASGHRTHICTYACLIALIGMIYGEYQQKLSARTNKIIQVSAWGAACVTLLYHTKLIIVFYQTMVS